MGKRQQYQQPKTVRNTCAVTGERLDFALPHVTIPDTDRIVFPKHARCPEDLHPDSPYARGYRLSVPYRFHARGTGHDGAPPISAANFKYMEAGEKEAERRRSCDAWWNDRTLVASLDAHVRSDRPRCTQEELDVALNWLSGFRGSAHLNHRTMFWIRRAVQRVRRVMDLLNAVDLQNAADMYEAAA